MAQAEIMQILIKNRGKYYTSAELSKLTGISRTAICRACTTMWKTGEIYAVPLQCKGYRYGLGVM